MVDKTPSSWKDTMTGRERVRAVVETLETSATVEEIADRAAVSATTANDELAQLAADNRVRKVLVDNKKGYELNPTNLFFEELQSLLEEHSRTELEAQLEELRSETETLCQEFDVDSLEMLREQLTDRELTAEETRTIRNAVSTWEALNTDLTLIQHALRLYDDVVELDTHVGTQTTVA